jgi:L-fucose mutarotase
MMEAVPGDTQDPAVESEYMRIVRKYAPATPSPQRIEREAFYTRARGAFAVVMTGELRKYGNLLMKKGVTPSD